MEELEFRNALTEKTMQTEEIIGKGFSEYLDRHRKTAHIKTITDAMEYSFLAGGKRLRPLLMRETFLLLGGNRLKDSEKREKALEKFMTALEMIHTYSLVHDDLPAMDNDEYRRGKETTWKVFGDGMGVLTGDALMNSAFEIAFEEISRAVAGQTRELLFTEDASARPEEIEKENAFLQDVAAAGVILARNAGVEGMLGGQAVDVESEKKGLPMTLDKLVFIHTKKTAALIMAAMEIGAHLAGTAIQEKKQIAEIARKVGIAFQIQDDILDVVGDSKQLGKPVGSDAENGKETYVTLKGLEESREEVRKLSEEAIGELHRFSGDGAFLEELIRFLIYRKK